jgi:nucleoside-diphosphate-sugar epimerase
MNVVDPNKLEVLRKNSRNGVVYVVGGAGYIGSRLVPALVDEGWGVVVVDNLIYGQPAPTDTDNVIFLNEDVLSMDVPAGNEPVIWLASMHRDAEEAEEHAERYCTLMVRRPLGWLAAGHPITYVSSASVLTDRSSLYATAKCLAEESFLQVTRAFQILRFGTVWGGLSEDPTRPQTAINRAILGDLPTEDYMAFTTHISTAVEALTYAPYQPYLGTLENVFDVAEPITGTYVEKAANENEIVTPWTYKFRGERRALKPERIEELKAMEHPCEAIRRFYWPKIVVSGNPQELGGEDFEVVDPPEGGENEAEA